MTCLRLPASPCRLFICVTVLACGHLRAAEPKTSPLPPVTINGPSFQVPSGNPVQYSRIAEEAPAPILDFREREGREWQITWDPLLETPQLFYPLGARTIVAPEVLRTAGGSESALDELRTAVLAFLEEHAGFIGVPPGQLAEPFIYPVRDSWVLVFGQTTAGGIRIRGANVRIVVLGDGRLGWVKGFLLRSAPDPVEALLDEATVLAAASSLGLDVRGARLQMSFPDEGSTRAVPTWSLIAAEPDETTTEVILDARDGTPLLRSKVVRYFDEEDGGGAGGQIPLPPVQVNGVVAGFELDANDQSVAVPIEGALIRAAGSIVGVSDVQGAFSVSIPALLVGADNTATIRASLDHGRCFPQAPAGWCFPAAAQMQREFSPDPPSPGLHAAFRLRVLPASLLPEDDPNLDRVPDAEVTADVGNALAIVFNNVHRDPGLLDAERSLWVVAHRNAFDSMDFAAKVLSACTLDVAPIAPFHCLSIEAQGTAVQQLAFQLGPPCRRLLASVDLANLRGGPPERLSPGLLLHELGHHTFLAITDHFRAVAVEGAFDRAGADPVPLHLEEGIADALAGMVLGSPAIGLLDTGLPTSRAFVLGVEEWKPRGPVAGLSFIRHALRGGVGNAFWRLHEQLRLPPAIPGTDPQAKEVTIGSMLLFAWLAHNRRTGPDDRIFSDAEDNLLEEILRIDDGDLFGGDDTLANRTPNWPVIVQAFRGAHYLDAPFIRGDADGDGRLNLADALGVLNFLFANGAPNLDCVNALDANNRDGVDLSDALHLLNALFLEGPPPAAPFPGCGLDPEVPWTAGPNDNLGCHGSSCAPLPPPNP